MFGKLFSSNKASIARKSNNNIVVQDSVLNNSIFCTGGSEMIKILGEIGRYDVVQKQVMDVLSATSKTHPLYPVLVQSLIMNYINWLARRKPRTHSNDFPSELKGLFELIIRSILIWTNLKLHGSMHIELRPV